MWGHSLVFRADDTTMHWECRRGCAHAGGAKRYDSAEDARRYAAAFNRKDSADLGKRAPLIGLLPLRLFRGLRRSAR